MTPKSNCCKTQVEYEMIFIPGNVPSSKNSKQWTGKFLVSSKVTRNYIKHTASIWKSNTYKWLELTKNITPPYHVGLYFIRDSKRRFDYINACQIVADLMVDYGWIEDDNADLFVPVFLGYEVDKINSGVRITVCP